MPRRSQTSTAEDLAAAARRKPRTVGTKVNQAFYDVLKDLAATRGMKVSDLVREALEDLVVRKPIWLLVLGEVLATREITLNAQHDLIRNLDPLADARVPITVESTLAYVKRADANKYVKAQARLDGQAISEFEP
jgi:hypothetical protein